MIRIEHFQQKGRFAERAASGLLRRVSTFTTLRLIVAKERLVIALLAWANDVEMLQAGLSRKSGMAIADREREHEKFLNVSCMLSYQGQRWNNL